MFSRFFKRFPLGILVVLATFFASNKATSQVMPVGVNVIMNPPAPVFLADYYGIGSNAFQAFVTLNDLNEPDWDVRLKIRVEGQGIVIETKPTFVPPAPINLISGVPQLLEGLDFSDYLNVNNVNLQGITASTLSQNGKLPEGLYQFCVEVLDYQTGTPLSQRNCGNVFIFYENPPILLTPACETALQPSDPQNIFFHWQIAGGASPTIAATSQYKLYVYELQDESEDPYYAVQNNKALLIYESEFEQSISQTIDFGISNSMPLNPGKRYIYRVRATDADGKNIYKNDGFSEFCWFFYGYPSDGIITLNSPADAHIFSKSENPLFSWSASNKGVPGQEYDYILVISEKNPGQSSEDAMDDNPEWFTVNLPTSSSMNGYDFLLTQQMETGKNYVWQVKAMTGSQQVAESPVYEFFAPSLMDEFYAGNTPVKVLSLTEFTKNGNQYTNVTGRGRIQLSNDPQDVVDIEFTNLTIKDFAGTYILSNGTCAFDLSQRADKVLQPVEDVNGEAKFKYGNGQITSAGLKINGHIEWPFPHATTSGALEYLTSKEQLFTLNSSYSLNGTVELGEVQEFELLEPYELTMRFEPNSQFNLSNDNYGISLNGKVLANKDVRTNNGEQFAITLHQQNQLNYITANNLLTYATNYLEPIEGLNIGFMPKKAFIDLSEDESPGQLSSSPSWKGVYFPEFQTRVFSSEFDASNQISIPENIDYHENLASSAHEFWITNQGIRLKYTFDSDLEGIKFNQFKTPLHGVLNITNNETSTSKFTGDIAIYVISEDDRFTFEVPVITSGVQQGYLNENLELRDIVFNPFGGENRVNVTINRAVFANNERLDLEIDAELVGFNTTVSGIDDFRIYGDNVIGVGSRNGSKPLDMRVAGSYHDYDAFITEVGAALFNGSFVFSYRVEMDLGEDVSGENGPPVLAVSSVTEAGSNVELPEYSVGSPQPQPSISVPDTEEASSSQTLTSVEMFIAVNNSIVDIEGYLKLRSNDPVWGNSFAGGINGKIKVPTEIQAGANMILGNKDDVDFWYFDAWFNDTEGMGLKVGPLFNITAMEGRIFRHMSKQDGEFMIDPNMAFGGAMFLQIIDPTGGRMFASDIGAELKVFEDGEFTINMSGDVAVLNQNVRTPTTGSITSAVGEGLVEAAVEAVGPLSLSVDVFGGTLTIEAEGLDKGSVGFEKDDYSINIGADVSSNPGVEFAFEKGSTNFNIEGNASGTFGVGVGFDGNEIGIGMSGSNGGYLDLAIDDLTIDASINRSAKTGSLEVGYGDKAIGIGVEPNGGFLNLQFASDKKFEAGYSSAGSAFIGFEYESNKFKLAGDKTNKSGSLEIDVDGFAMTIAGNATEKSAEFAMDAEGFEVGLSGKYGTGGAFHLLAGDVEVDVSANLEEHSGLLAFSYDGGNKAFSASLDGGDQGALSFKNGSQEFGISGNADGSAGSVTFKDGSNEFSVAADRNEGTGSLVLNIGGEGISSGVSPDSGYVSLTVGGVSMAAGVNASGAGGFQFANGGDSFTIFGDPANQTGSFDLTFDGNEVALSTNIPQNEHSILIDAGGVLFDARTSSTEKSLALGYQNYNFKLATEGSSSGSGSAGSISISDGTNSFDLAADPGAGTGSLTVDLDGNGVNSAIESDTAYLNFEYDGYSFKTGVSSSGTGGVFYSDGSNSFEFVANPGSQKGNIGLEISGSQFALSTDIPNNEHALNISTSGVEFSADISSGKKELKASYSDYAVHAKNEGSDYEVGLEIGGRSIKGGIVESQPQFAYSGDGIALEISSDRVKLAKNGHTLEISETELLIDGSTVEQLVSSATISFTKQFDDLSTTIALNSGEYSLSFNHSGKSFTVTTSDFENGTLELELNGNTYGLALDNGKYALSVNDLIAAYESGSLTLEKGQDRNLSITSNGLSVAYDGYSFGVTPSSLTYSDGTNSAKLNSEGISLSRNDNELFVSEDEFGLSVGQSKRLALTRSSIEIDYDDFSASYGSDGLIASISDYSIGYADSELSLSQGSNRSLGISADGLDIEFDGYSFSASNSSLSYTDGTNSASISENGLSLIRGDNEMFIGEESFGVTIGESKSVSLTRTSLDVQYDNYTASFSSGESLSFSDGTRSFGLSTSGLEMSDGDKSIAVYDDGGLPAIRLTNGDNLFELGQSGFAVEYDGRRYAVNETENLTVEIDESRSLQLMNNGIKYVEGSYEFILGGDDNLVELKDGDSRSIALTQDDELVVKDGDYYGSLSKNLEVELRDGTRTLKLLKDDKFLSYEQNGYNFAIRGANATTPGIEFSDGDYTFFIEGVQNSGVSVGVGHSSFGEFSASVNSTKDITVLMGNPSGSVYGFLVDNGNISMVNGSIPEPPTPEHLEGAPTIPAQDGPQHLTNSIAEDAGGSIRGEANIFFDSRQSRFMMNAAVAGNKPVCIEGAMAMDVSPGQFHLDIGTEQQRVEIFPTCSGFGGGGWLGIHNANVDIGVFAAWRASASISIGSDAIGASLSAEAGAEIGARANVTLDPFKINRAGVWVEVYAGIYAKYWFLGGSGSLTIAEARLRGELDVYFEAKTRVEGRLAGHIIILDIIEESFDMSFKTSF